MHEQLVDSLARKVKFTARQVVIGGLAFFSVRLNADLKKRE
jgi:hypothetical protein